MWHGDVSLVKKYRISTLNYRTNLNLHPISRTLSYKSDEMTRT